MLFTKVQAIACHRKDVQGMKWTVKSFDQLSTRDLYALLALRTDVFVVEQECPYPELDGRDLFCHHLLVEEEGQLVAYLRILPKGQSFADVSIGRVVIKQSHRGKGLAKPLMEKALDYILQEWQEERVMISAQAHLEQFYSQLGFEPVSEVYLEDGIPHLDMLYQAVQG